MLVGGLFLIRPLAVVKVPNRFFGRGLSLSFACSDGLSSPENWKSVNNILVFSLLSPFQADILEETIRYIDSLHQTLIQRIEANGLPEKLRGKKKIWIRNVIRKFAPKGIEEPHAYFLL